MAKWSHHSAKMVIKVSPTEQFSVSLLLSALQEQQHTVSTWVVRLSWLENAYSPPLSSAGDFDL